jgi:serine protease AprX
MFTPSRKPQRSSLILGLLALVALGFGSAEVAAQGRRARLSEDLKHKIATGDVRPTSVILTASNALVDEVVARHGLRVSKRLATGAVLEVPAGALAGLVNDAAIDQLSGNSVVQSSMALTNEAIGETLLRSGQLGAKAAELTGNGVGVAVIDSGVANVPELKGRVKASVDFTGTSDRDEFGHGTHVAGIIAAAGVNKNDETSGVAPGADIISLKVLDAKGAGLAGNVIAAIDWVLLNKDAYNIKVINLSLGAPVLQ